LAGYCYPSYDGVEKHRPFSSVVSEMASRRISFVGKVAIYRLSVAELVEVEATYRPFLLAEEPVAVESRQNTYVEVGMLVEQQLVESPFA
jgi:hypothetical protein